MGDVGHVSSPHLTDNSMLYSFYKNQSVTWTGDIVTIYESNSTLKISGAYDYLSDYLL